MLVRKSNFLFKDPLNLLFLPERVCSRSEWTAEAPPKNHENYGIGWLCDDITRATLPQLCQRDWNWEILTAISAGSKSRICKIVN